MQLVRISLFQSWNWEESTFEVFDWIQELYTVTWFPVPGNVTKRVSSNGVHLHIKIQNFAMSTWFRPLTRNSFYAFQLLVHLISHVTSFTSLTVSDNTWTWLKGSILKPLLGAIEKRQNKANTVWLSIPHFQWNILTVTRQMWITWLRVTIEKLIKRLLTWKGTCLPSFTKMRGIFFLEIKNHWIRGWVKP